MRLTADEAGGAVAPDEGVVRSPLAIVLRALGDVEAVADHAQDDGETFLVPVE